MGKHLGPSMGRELFQKFQILRVGTLVWEECCTCPDYDDLGQKKK
jgi:hypothetical protein